MFLLDEETCKAGRLLAWSYSLYSRVSQGDQESIAISQDAICEVLLKACNHELSLALRYLYKEKQFSGVGEQQNHGVCFRRNLSTSCLVSFQKNIHR